MTVEGESVFVVDAEEIAQEIRKAASESISEEDLRQGVEYVLKSRVIEKLQIPWGSWRPPKARYEVTLVSGARLDALYGHVIIEYERPKAFETKSGFESAVEQVKGYIRDHAQIEARFPRYFGVVIDGYKIGFVRYREVLKGFESKGPFDVNRSTVARLVEAIVGLRRKALSADDLLKDFGPDSQVARDSITAFYGKLLGTTPRTEVLFDDWRRVFSQVCAYSPDKLKGLEKDYGFVGKDINVEKLLFSLHTYFALIMKLLAAEVAALYVAPRLWSYLKALEDAYFRSHEKLKDELKELEEGGIFAKLGITNFLEADYFAWYLDEWDEQLAKHITNIIRKLSDYDPSAAELEPERVKDLFKRVYQNLAPKTVRHDLGEYYTPDWLAELALNEAGWTLETFEKKAQESGSSLAPLELRLLDPACGSGTFLVLAISRLRNYIEEHWVDKSAALRRITRNIVGFDLNPLAVIASRTNYLIALGDMLREKGAETIEIPVYMADSIMVEQRPTVFGASAYILKTVTGEFIVPINIVEKGLLANVLSIIEECVRGKYALNEFRARLLKEFLMEETEISLFLELFKTLTRLENEGKNKIWLRVLKNSFAPFFAGRFDYVVGNPPWINWESLPEDYRNASAMLWDKYGLKAKASAKQFELGKMRRDISMLFVYVCSDRYLHDTGSLGFLITQTVFKAKGAEVFRRFRLPGGVGINVLKVHDMVTLKPFEEAANMTSMIILKKGSPTTYPVPYVRWSKLRKVDLTNATLDEAYALCSQSALVALPVYPKDPTSQWLTGKPSIIRALNKITGFSAYKAYEGVHPAGANGVYWVKILEKRSAKTIIIENLPEMGKKKPPKVIETIESDLIYPLIRSGDIKRWIATPLYYTVIPHTKTTGWRAISESSMKVDYPKTYGYLLKFKDFLFGRSAYKLLRKGHPFYTMIDIHKESFAPFKITWKQIGNKIDAAVLSSFKDDYIGIKTPIPQWTLAFVPSESEDEAHYLCSIMSSTCVEALIKLFSQLGGKGFAPPSIIDRIRIPSYDNRNPIHRKLAELSKKAHELAIKGAGDELTKVEFEIDNFVSQLYRLTDEEFKEIRKSVKIFEGEEVEEEEVEEVPILEPDITLTNPIAEENIPFNLEIVITNPLENSISNVKIKAQLLTKMTEQLFHRIEKEEKVQVTSDALKKGNYTVKLIMDYTFEGSSKRIEKELTLFVKAKEERKPVERGDIEELFGD
jgi:hypothetical protein